jgi:hypothetical protein
MCENRLPDNLNRLHAGEEGLRAQAIAILDADDRLLLHLGVTECTMDLLDVLRQFETNDEDFKVVQMLGMRLFNAFGSSIKLMLSGYSQTSAMLLRDVLETVFLLDFFRTNREAITTWRIADKKQRLRDFKPVRIREALDGRDGFTEKKREQMYDMFSELASHPTMQSVAMLRPRGMDARNGPFIDATALEAVVSEMGRMAIQVGEIMDAFFPSGWRLGDETRGAFARAKARWIDEFYGDVKARPRAAPLMPAALER